MESRRPPLAPGDGVRVVAPSRSLAALRDWAGFTEADLETARKRLEAMGLRVSFGAYVEESSDSGVASVESRVADFHDALREDSVRAIVALSGGTGAIQMLEHIDYDLAREKAKVVIGYSDVGYLHTALLTRAGLVGYYGPNFTSFAMKEGFEPSAAWFRACLFSTDPVDAAPSSTWSDDNWLADQENRTFRPGDGFWCLREGSATGTVVGGSAFCLNFLQGTPYFPDLADAVLFLESPGHGKASLMAIDTSLRSLAMLPAFHGVAGIVLGRFPSSARVDRAGLQRTIGAIDALDAIPVLANVDFGHTTPAMTIPVGGACRLIARQRESRLTLLHR